MWARERMKKRAMRVFNKSIKLLIPNPNIITGSLCFKYSAKLSYSSFFLSSTTISNLSYNLLNMFFFFISLSAFMSSVFMDLFILNFFIMLLLGVLVWNADLERLLWLINLLPSFIAAETSSGRISDYDDL